MRAGAAYGNSYRFISVVFTMLSSSNPPPVHCCPINGTDGRTDTHCCVTITIHDNVYGVVEMTKVIATVYPVRLLYAANPQITQCSRKRVQQLKKNVKSHVFLKYEKT